jgi:hypothetical protein
MYRLTLVAIIALVVITAPSRASAADPSIITIQDEPLIACVQKETITFAAEFYMKTGSHPRELLDGDVPLLPDMNSNPVADPRCRSLSKLPSNRQAWIRTFDLLTHGAHPVRLLTINIDGNGYFAYVRAYRINDEQFPQYEREEVPRLKRYIACKRLSTMRYATQYYSQTGQHPTALVRNEVPPGTRELPVPIENVECQRIDRTTATVGPVERWIGWVPHAVKIQKIILEYKRDGTPVNAYAYRPSIFYEPPER